MTARRRIAGLLTVAAAALAAYILARLTGAHPPPPTSYLP